MRRLFWLLFSVFMVALSSTTQASVDRRSIEMPFGPGPGERALPLVFSYSQDAFSGSSRYGLLSLDFEYQNSISDEFALVWAPLPLGLIIRDPNKSVSNSRHFAGVSV